MRRRDALVLGGAVAVAVAIPPVLRRIPSHFEFQPLPGAAGFRRLMGGAYTGGVDPFFGLEPDSVAAVTHDTPLCPALFGQAGWPTGTVPIAIFTDVNCPYCKVLDKRLRDIETAGAPVRLIWHDLPLQGPRSIRAARAVMAATFLDAGALAREFVNSRVLRPGPLALQRMAEDIGVDPENFVAMERSTQVDNRLADSLALGRRLAIPGTPGTVVGRTVVIGAIKDADLKRLIDIEAETPQSVCT
ncbi:MAG: DsbA family protein [Roseobacter sp.]